MSYAFFYRVALFLSFSLLASPVVAQTSYRISGRVSDGATGEGIPFASIAIKGTITGAISELNGSYTLVTKQTGDSLLVSSVGYQPRTYRVVSVVTQTIDVALTAAANRLEEVKIYARGGDPAYRIIREAVRRGDQFNTDNIPAYQYESYAKTEAYVDNLIRKDRKSGKKSVLAKLPSVVGEDGKPAVPIFVSETYSEYYARANPSKVKERVVKSRSSGIGVSQGNLVAQLTGASFQQYNFYGNYVRLLRKDLPSPLGQYWETMYTFRLLDTVLVGNVVCFQIDFAPKRTQDIAFNGTVWIDTLALGLSKINAHIDRRANINFVNDIELQQEWEAITDSTNAPPVRLPVETSLSLDMAGGSAKNPGLMIRFLLLVQNPSVNRVYEPDFYEPVLELVDNYKESTPGYWKDVRPTNLSDREMRAFALVDSMRNTQPMKTFDKIVKVATYGYLSTGVQGLEFGPTLYSYAYNNVEGNRFRLGLRTNKDFSQRWSLNGYAAYGTLDHQVKYGVGAEYVIQKKPWTVVGFEHSYDLEQLGINSDLSQNTLFKAFTRFGTLRRPYMQETDYTYLRRDLGSGFTQTVGIRNRTFEPRYAFAYQLPEQDRPSIGYQTTELTFETRFSPGGLTLQDNSDRFTVGSTNKPVVVFRYDLSLKSRHSDFSFHRFSLTLDQSFRLGTLGRTTYQLKLGYTPSTLPYPMLFIPRGSNTIYRLGSAYNLMGFFEFATDRYAGLMVEHRFQGFLFNRIPLIRRLKWRFVATGKLLMGGVSEANKNLIPATTEQGRPVLGFQSLTSTPYVEVGYGIENIFKFLRVDAVHRLTYRTNPGVSTFGIRLSTRIGL